MTDIKRNRIADITIGFGCGVLFTYFASQHKPQHLGSLTVTIGTNFFWSDGDGSHVPQLTVYETTNGFKVLLHNEEKDKP